MARKISIGDTVKFISFKKMLYGFVNQKDYHVEVFGYDKYRTHQFLITNGIKNLEVSVEESDRYFKIFECKILLTEKC